VVCVVASVAYSLRLVIRSRASLHLEIIALRHQLAVINRSRPRRLRLSPADRLLWAWLSQAWRDWRTAVHMVKPETVIAWHQHGFRLFWTWKSRRHLRRPWRHWICRKRADWYRARPTDAAAAGWLRAGSVGCRIRLSGWFSQERGL